MNRDFENRKEELLDEVRDVLNEAENLYESAVDDGTAQAKVMKEKLKIQLEKAKQQFSALEATVTDKAKYAAKQTDELVHEKPYHAVGVAAAAGLVLGLLLSRGGSSRH